MRKSRIAFALTAACLASVTSKIIAQNSILLFSPVNVRQSQSSASYTDPVYFSSNTLNLSCPAAPLAVLSSAPASSPLNSGGYILVDNNINVTVTPAGGSANATKNVCIGGVDDTIQNCFSKSSYQDPASAGTLVDVNPDTLLPDGGVPPIDISSYLVPGAQQVKIELEDEGYWLASSTIYLNTNCTSAGVSAPATLSGNTISSVNPPASQLTQAFTFNPLTDTAINFQYDLSTAQTAGTLSIDRRRRYPFGGRFGDRSKRLPDHLGTGHIFRHLNLPYPRWRETAGRPSRLQSLHAHLHRRHRQRCERRKLPRFDRLERDSQRCLRWTGLHARRYFDNGEWCSGHIPRGHWILDGE